jgi:cytochrome c-type biogenesis protein CcmH
MMRLNAPFVARGKRLHRARQTRQGKGRMGGTWFWAAALGLAGSVALVLVAALRRSGGTGSLDRSADLAIYKDQLAEIERDLARGTIGAGEAERLRVEVGRRLLDADRQEARPAKAEGHGLSGFAMAAVLAAVVPGAAAVYWGLGAPGYPDMPLGPRLAGLDAAIAERPGQTDELRRLGKPRDPARDTALQAELAAVTDPDRLRADFRGQFGAGDYLAAFRAQERLLDLVADQATAADHANLALSLVAEAEGYVSPEAEAALRETLTLDMSNELARYLVGEMFLQGGRFDQAFRFWRPLVEDGTAEAPWVASIRERIGMVAELAGIRYDAPTATGPSAEDMETAADLSPEDRQAMIEGMVAQLSDRLATDGGSVEEWERLIRSLAVLERLPEAQTIYDEAKVKFEGRPAELSFLRMAAVESGLNP